VNAVLASAGDGEAVVGDGEAVVAVGDADDVVVIGAGPVADGVAEHATVSAAIAHRVAIATAGPAMRVI
jgi:hypothetical protein